MIVSSFPDYWPANQRPSWPQVNTWLGVSVENQATADKRIPLLLRTPAALHYVSVEPCIGPVDLSALTDWPDDPSDLHQIRHGRPHLSWCVVGGESGPGARPMHPDWVRGLRDQCTSAGTPFFFKQWGEWSPCGPMKDDADYAGGKSFEAASGGTCAIDCLKTNRFRMLKNTIMERIGKKPTGRMLDGRIWDEMPEVT